MTGSFHINGAEIQTSFGGDELLLDVLRKLGCTEVKEGCREGACGSCLVLLDGVLVNSCQVLAASVLGREITTVKGLGTFHEPHPIQEAFVEAATALNMLPVPWVEARDISNAVLFLASDESRYITGVTLPIDAGSTQR